MVMNSDQILLITSLPASCPAMSPTTTPIPVFLVKLVEVSKAFACFSSLYYAGISFVMIAFCLIEIKSSKVVKTFSFLNFMESMSGNFDIDISDGFSKVS